MREMKDSGIEWIGKIPKHWELANYRRVFSRRKEYDDNPNKQVLSLTIEGVKEKNESFGKMAEDFTGHQIVRANDLVFTPRDFDATPILSGIAPCDGCISNLYFVLYPRTEDVNVKFYNYFMWGVKWGGDIWKRLSYGMRFSYNYGQFCALPTIKIPLEEQQAIADYLDGECARIDGIVTTQRQIIERLKEYKKSVITEAVTRGLNPDAPMKDSGIEWIGKIPAHWKAGKTFYCLEDIGSGTTPSGEDYYTEDGINWLNTGDLTDGYIREIPKKITPKAMEDFSTLKLHQENSIVIAMYGATIGKLGIITEKTTTNQACCVMTPNKDLSYKFLFYCLYAGKDYMMYLSFGSGQPNINQNILRHFIIPHIPIEEQQAIADYLDRECARIDTIIEKRERMIELVTEYKKSLIYECVTGKKEIVDVVE